MSHIQALKHASYSDALFSLARPTHTDDDLLEKAEHLLSVQRIEPAIATFIHAEHRGADADRCAGGRWFCWMLKGEFERAWKESDAIFCRGAPDPNRFWSGEPFDGKHVIVRCLHGHGDAIQMLRYAPLLLQRTSHLTFEVSPQFYDLARCFQGVDRVIRWGGSCEWDLQMEVMEFPYIFRTTLATIPTQIPYLALPANSLENARMLANHARGPHVGLFWAGGQWNSSRSVPFTALYPILAIKDICFWSLQSPEENQEWTTFWLEQTAYPRTCSHGLLSAAALIQQMDLIITIDSMAAHLAGALGKPVWTLLPRYADWRWMMARNDSPWYPTMRLFRQQKHGCWDDVIHAVADELNIWREQFR